MTANDTLEQRDSTWRIDLLSTASRDRQPCGGQTWKQTCIESVINSTPVLSNDKWPEGERIPSQDPFST